MFLTVFKSVVASVKITCTAFVDNILHSVYYGDSKLDVHGDTGDASKMKTFAFETNQTSTEANIKLKVEVEDHQPKDHCLKWAGFILQCKAKDQNGKEVESSPWHKFTSNTNEWQSEGGSALCKIESGWLNTVDLSGVQELLSAGASVIWTTGKKTTVLIGSPSLKGSIFYPCL